MGYKPMKPAKLSADDLFALSNGLLLAQPEGLWGKMLILLLREVKVKVDKKIAGGYLPANGCTIKLTPSQFEAMKILSKLMSAGRYKDVEFGNAIYRLLVMNNGVSN